MAVIGREPDNVHSKKKVRITVKPIFAGARIGDKTCNLPNCTLPVVLHQKGDSYQYVGEVYPSPYEVETLRAYERIFQYSYHGATDYARRNFDKRIRLY